MTVLWEAATKSVNLVKCGCRRKGVILGEFVDGVFWRKAGDCYIHTTGAVRCPECEMLHEIDVLRVMRLRAGIPVFVAAMQAEKDEEDRLAAAALAVCTVPGDAPFV